MACKYCKETRKQFDGLVEEVRLLKADVHMLKHRQDPRTYQGTFNRGDVFGVL